jgi:predicted NUDIX family phosphoesterase
MKNEMEKVLVFESNLLKPYISCFNRGCLNDANVLGELLNNVLNPANNFYVYRHVAEKDESIKQIIPYTVLYDEDRCFMYRRTKAGGENRLHDKFSIGVGGHINPVDGAGTKETFEVARQRELSEEVTIWTDDKNWPWPASTIMAIYDNSDSVGRVHFGVVCSLRCPKNRKLEFHDPSLADGVFVTTEE